MAAAEVIAGGVLSAIATWLGLRRKSKRAASTAEAIEIARRVSKVAAALLHAGSIHLADVVDTWERRFADAVRLAGLQLTPEQERAARAAGRAELDDIAQTLLVVNGHRLEDAAARLQRRLEQLFPEPKKGAKR